MRFCPHCKGSDVLLITEIIEEMEPNSHFLTGMYICMDCGDEWTEMVI